MGGFGFRDLELFNQALLSKQGWRVLSNPSSLLVWVLKFKYFKDGSFLEASVRSNASFIWRSLLWGRNLLCAGLHWQVGTGDKIEVYDDNWIPRDGSLAIQSVPTLPRNSFVCDLCTPSGVWDVEKVRAHFVDEEATAILSIPIGVSPVDKLIWDYEKRGIFSVTSGYRVLQQALISQGPSSSSLDSVLQWSKGFWKIQLPSKIKIFGWRLCLDSLPMGENLQARGLNVLSICRFCGCTGEGAMHVFWACTKIRRVWVASKFSHLTCQLGGADFTDMFNFVRGWKELVS